MVNDWWDVRLWVGIGGEGLFGGRDNRLRCLVFNCVGGAWLLGYDNL